MNKPKMRSMKAGEKGISEKEFDSWLALQLKSGIKVYSFGSKANDSFYATSSRITRKENMSLEGVLYNVKPVAKKALA